MNQSSQNLEQHPSRLQQEIAQRIVDIIQREGLGPGERLNESRLSQELAVSRTPIRGALEILIAQGIVVRKPNRGVEIVTRPPVESPDIAPPDSDDDLVVKIARDRLAGRLAENVSEAELMRHYGVGRPAVRATLSLLADLGVVGQRVSGYGWSFTDSFQDHTARRESYSFRMSVECSALLAPDFELSQDWADDMTRQHEAVLSSAMSGAWTVSSSISFFEMNAAFHEGLSAASGNRYFAHAVRQQNQLRRLSNYNWIHGAERVVVNSREHLEILERVQDGDREVAAALMRRHLERASNLSPSFADG